MNARRIWAIARKEFIHVLRDPRSLGIALAIPALMLVLFGYALTLDVDHVPILAWDQSGSPASRAFLAQFAGSRYFTLTGFTDHYADIERAIDAREVVGALVIPRDFAERIGSRRTASVQFLVDGSDANTATIVLGYAAVVTSGYNRDIFVERIQRMGGQPPRNPLDVRARVWFNEDLESKNFIVPGLIAVIMSVIAALLSSLTVAREWEHGTMEQLISTPVKPPELILGKLLPYFAIGMCDMVIAVVMGVEVFGVPFRGSAVLLVAMSAVFLLGALGQGILISTFSRSQLMAGQIAILSTFLPSFLLSGFAFAIANMPRPLQWVTYLVSARYFVILLKGIYLKGIGLEVLGADAALLGVYSLVLVVLAIRAFKKKLT